MGEGLAALRAGARVGTGRARFSISIRQIGAPHYHGRELFGREQVAELSAALQALQGRFNLSLNDVPEVRELFAWARIETVELSYQAGGADYTKRVREVVICGVEDAGNGK
ncbi:hypothetical protein [Bosea sp. (in: a-proteobacteria)]|uniref:hypothetical protein n=1 Tax=Bosea sp. (in: a-proteobacteria) TaxID=1871050 RepID=UPI001AC07F27|nr:hypothetical protein [Bosea sp. (in: a-proteobacteria)]MBN9438940.1 hypothetical protein [Bosea sp. (in: a-proteobacteria)]